MENSLAQQQANQNLEYIKNQYEGLRTPDPEYSTGLGKKKKELPQTTDKGRRRKYFYMFPRRQRQLTSA